MDEMRQVASESSQAMVWLVGLASSLLALAGAYPERVQVLLRDDYKSAILCLMTCVAAGVVYRLIGLRLMAMFSIRMLQLRNYLAGYEAGREMQTAPTPLQVGWDEQEIVRRLSSEFGLDYSFLLVRGAPLDMCREAYVKQVEVWDQGGNEEVGRLLNTTAAFLGLTAKEASRFGTVESVDGTIDGTRWHGIGLRGWFFVNGFVFAVASVAFVVAVFFVARGLWRI